MKGRRLKGWIVRWCGGECAGNPHPTKAAAERWLREHMESARAAKVPVYGSYTIEYEGGGAEPRKEGEQP